MSQDLPPYPVPSPTSTRAPSYSLEPGAREQRLYLHHATQPRFTDTFIKQSKGGDLVLRLSGQPHGAQVPQYGTNATVSGTVEIHKPDTVSSVEIQVEGRLKLKEIAEGGSDSIRLCSLNSVPWSRSARSPQCPTLLSFSLSLPRTFTHSGAIYPLPPTYTTKLPGMPGFFASIDYRITVALSRPTTSKSLLKKNSIFGANSSNISTPFLYSPRTQPSRPIPIALHSSPHGLMPNPEWRSFESVIKAKTSGHSDIVTRLFLPASRIFYMGQAIPFRIQYEAPSFTLSAFLPYGPISHDPPPRRPTKIELIRQTIVDVRNSEGQSRNQDSSGNRTNIWRVDSIGRGSFTHSGDGPTWIAFSGAIEISRDIKVTGFKAAGLNVKDCIVLTMTPRVDPQKSPFRELRLVIPVRLTTDPYAQVLSPGMPGSAGTASTTAPFGDAEEMSIPSSPSEETLATPPLYV